MVQAMDADVLVVGAGAAGCRAALEAQAAGADVIIVVKGGFGRVAGLRGTGASGCAGSPLGFSDIPHMVGGSRVEVRPEDEQDLLYKLMIQVGLGMADPKLVEILLSEAPEAKSGLKRWGLVVDESPPFIHCFITPIPGLTYAVRATGAIRIVEQVMVAELLVKDGACAGAVGVSETTGEPVVFNAKSVILATGGAGQLYMHHFQPSCVTGDGYAMAYAAGAEMLNIEFQQMIWATTAPTTNILPGIWGAHPRFLNNRGEEFLPKYLPAGLSTEEVLESKLQHWPFSSRDISKYIDIAAVLEARAGGANEHHGFLVGTSDFNSSWGLLMVPHSKEYLEFRGIDWNSEYIEANVSYHCQNGGIRINENAETTVPRLYAVGETAAGPYGVDRIAGSMMSSGQVFGMRAGRHAAAMSRRMAMPKADEKTVTGSVQRLNALGGGNGGRRPEEYIGRLQKSAWENLLVVKSEDSLSKLLKDIGDIRGEIASDMAVQGAADLVKALELGNLLQTGEIISSAARMRKESRGNHYREDFPEQDDKNWLKSITVKKDGGRLKVGTCLRNPAWQSKAGDMDGLSWG